MDAIIQNLRYAARQLWKSPGFTAIAILSLALGIGANTAIFTLINSLMLKSLPVHDPQHLVSFGIAAGGGEMDGIGPGPLDIFPYDFYRQVEHQHDPFQDVTGFASFPAQVSIRTGSGGMATQANAHLVSGNFFSVLGVEPIIGRAIQPSDTATPGSNPVAVLNYRYWQQTFNGDASILGKTITVNGTAFTVVGVTPPKFYGVELNEESPDMWMPITMQQEVLLQPSLLTPHGLFWMHMMGRLKVGVSPAQAQAWTANQIQQFMTAREGASVLPTRAQEIKQIYVQMVPGGRGISHLREQFSQPLYILMGVVVLVLTIACANLANFLLAKAATREREISTRLALGASRRRIVWQVLTEALLLSSLGGLCGLVLAFFRTRLLMNFIVAGAVHSTLNPTPDLRALAFTYGISVLTGVFFGIAPALRTSRMRIASAMGARTISGTGTRRTRLLPKILVTAQVVLSLVLLVGAGLFLRTLQNLKSMDFGFERHNLLLADLNTKFAGYKTEQLGGLHERILNRLSALPGVRSASLSGGQPISFGSWDSPIFIDGRKAAPNQDVSTFINRVSANYFETVGIQLLQGRTISPQDTATSTKSVVVSKSMADYFFPHGDAIGHQFTVGDPSVKGTWQIVGIVRDAKYSTARETPRRMIYLALEQLTEDDHYAFSLQVRSVGDPAKIANEVRAALAEVDPNIPILGMKTISEQVELSMENERLISQLSSFFSFLALALACIGLYGVMMYNVVRRTNEIGIRIALGAQNKGVLWMVITETLWLLAIGIAIGIPATLATAKVIQSQLFELSPFDPVTISASVVIICAVVLLAAYIPARRAANVDPMVALRYE
jgi:predicted permease